MASNNLNLLGSVHRWIEKKPLNEALEWTYKEKFWLVAALQSFGINDWTRVAVVVKNAGESYRPNEWYTSKSCEYQFNIIVSNISTEIKAKSFKDMLSYIIRELYLDYKNELTQTTKNLENNYNQLVTIANRIKQGNLSRNEVADLYSQAKRNEIEGKLYMEELTTKQNAFMDSQNDCSELSEDLIKWHAPAAPLLTSLLRSRNSIPIMRTASTINSLLQSGGGTSRTRSGKLLSVNSNVKTTTQGTPTLSKLLEAPANPYLPSPQQASPKNKLSDTVETDKLVENTSRKENPQSTSLNRVQVDNSSTAGSFNQINRIDLSASKRQTPKSPVSAVKNGSKANTNVVNLLSDSDNDEDDKSPVQSLHPKNLFGDKKDNIAITTSNSNRIETRATRSQTRAEGNVKHLNDSKLSGGMKERETLRQCSGESQITETHAIDDELIDIDQIEIEPLTSVQDEAINHTPSKITRSSMQRLRLNSPAENALPNKMKNKEINNQMLEEISANFVLNSTVKNVATEYKNVMVGQSRIDNASLSGCLVPVEAVKDAILLCEDDQSFSHPANTLTTVDGKLLKQKNIIEIKGANLRCIDGKNDTKYLSISNQPLVVVNKIRKPFNIKPTSSEANDKIDEIQVTKHETKKSFQLNNSPQNLVQLLDGNSSLTDEVIIIDDDVTVNVDETTKNKEISSNNESQNSPSTVAETNESGANTSGKPKSIGFQLNPKTTKNNKVPWNMFGKNHNILDISSKKSRNHDGASKIGIKSNINDNNSRFIKELDFDFDQSISQTSLSELYNGVEEIVEMHSFDNEELNSLIECGSLDSSETEERQNTVNLDQGDSSVSESDSTIGAFDTFAQITRVTQKLSSKEVESINKDSKTIKLVGKDLESDEGIVQSDEVDDDQSIAASVTGIPILQGVISDVMSKIDSDRVAALKVVDIINESTDEVVEISSDEEELSPIKNQFPSSVTEKEKPRIEITQKLEEDEMNNIKVLERNSILLQKFKDISKEIKETFIDPIKTSTFQFIRPVSKSIIGIESNLSIKELESKGTKRKHIELEKEIDIRDVSIGSEAIRNENTFKDAEVKKLKSIEFQKAAERCERELKLLKVMEEKRLKEMFEQIMVEEKKMKEIEERKKREMREAILGIEVMSRQDEAERIKRDFEFRKKEEERKRKCQEERKRKEVERIRKEEARIRKEKEIKKEVEEKNKKEEERKKNDAEVKWSAIKIKEDKFEELDKVLREKVAERDKLESKVRGKNEFEVEIMKRSRRNAEKIKKITELIKLRGDEIKKSYPVEIDVSKSKEIELLNKARKSEVIIEKEHMTLSELKRMKEEKIKKAIEDNIRLEKIQEAAEAIRHKVAIKKEKEAIIKRKKEAEMKAKEEEKNKLRREAMGPREIEKSEMTNYHFGPRDTGSKAYLTTKAKDLEDFESRFEQFKRGPIKIKSLKKTKQSILPMLNEEVDIFKSKVKENVTKPDAMKVLTRTRGLKNEEKIKEHNFDFKNVNDENMLNDLDTSCKLLNDLCRRASSKSLIDKTRTRSSSFKLIDTVSRKKSVTSSQRELPTTSLEFQKCTVGSSIEPTLKALTVKLKAERLPMYKEKIEAMKKSCIRVLVDEPLSPKPVNAKEIIEKPPPKKRGRKRRIDIQDEKSNSQKLKFQNGTRTNYKVGPALTKRTRSSADLIREREEETLDIKSIANKLLKKNVLRLIVNNISESNMYLSSTEKQVKDLCLFGRSIVKRPVDLKCIKKKISIGSIQSIADIQIYLMFLSYNAIMINRTDTIVFSDASNFQEKLLSDIHCFRCALATDEDILSEKKNDNDDCHKNNTDDDEDDYVSVNENIDGDRLIIENSENNGLNDIVNEEPTGGILKYMDISSDDSCSDSESDGYSLPHNKRRKIEQSYVNTSDSNSDSDDYESDV